MSQIFLTILGLALFTWVAKYFFVLYHYRRKKENINKLEARVAVLRMLLKAKLKRKGSQMQEQYKDEKEFLGSVISKLELLGTFSFNRSSDYTEAISLLTTISEATDMHTVQKTPAFYMAHQQKLAKDKESLLKISGVEVEEKDEQGNQKPPDEIASKQKAALNAQFPEYDRWAQLLKYDKGNLYIIKEIIETTEELKEKIDLYNIEQDNKELQIRPPELISIDGFEGLRTIVDLDQKKSKLNKEENKAKRKKDLRSSLNEHGDTNGGNSGDSAA